MTQRNQLFKGFFVLLASILLLAGCGSGEGENASAGGSSFFGDYAVAASVESRYMVYAENAGQFSIETTSLPVETDYYAVYDGKLYYADAGIGRETGEVENGRCAFYRCELDGKNPEIVLELSDVSYVKAFIQDGILYCGWESSVGELKNSVVELSTGKTTEFDNTSGRAIRALSPSGYYYEDEGKVFYCDYDGEEKTLFCEPVDEINGMYRNDGKLCVLLGSGAAASLSVYDDDGKCTASYDGLETVDELKGYFIRVIKSEGDVLYYELGVEANQETGMENTKLVRLDLKSGLKEIGGSWYTP